MEDISKALAAITARNNSIQEEKAELARGPAGPRGEIGPSGKDGAPAPPPKVQVGLVQVGDQAKVTVREIKPGSFEFDFVLPRAERGPAGRDGSPGKDGLSIKGDPGRDGESICGPQGPPGEAPEIKVGDVTAGENPAVFAHKLDYGKKIVLDFTIPKGKDGVGIQGPAGKDGLNEDDIRTIVRDTIIDTLKDVGVSNAHVARLVAVRAILKKKLNQATARHIGEIRDLVGEVDRLFDQD